MGKGMVIVGGGLAGGTAAETLREEGYDGAIRIIGAEPHRPYQRPPLSKGYLAGSEGLDAVYLHDADWYREHEIELSEGTVVASLDLSSHEVVLEDGGRVGYEKLLVATGAEARRLHIDGSDANGIHYLRTIEDSEAIRDAFAAGGKRVVLVGSGWIGLEIAAAARGHGNEATVIGLEAVPLSGVLGDEVGRVFAELHREHGVTLLGETSVEGFEVADGRVTGVRTSQGVLPADVVVVGVGAVPNVALAEKAGLDVDHGILVDEHLRTSGPDVYAAGDVANALHPFVGTRMRNEHWATAIDSGKAAALSMLGRDGVLDDVPYFFTDQYDLGMEYAGFPPLVRGSSVVFRGDPASREFLAFWVADGRVVAGMNVNVWDVNDDIKALITSRKLVDAARLSDPDVALADV